MSSATPPLSRRKVHPWRKRVGYILGGLLTAFVLAGIIGASGPAAMPLLAATLMALSVSTGVLLAMRWIRWARAQSPELYKPRDPAKVRRARRTLILAMVWSFFIFGGLAAIWLTGHPAIAVVGLIWYALLSLLIPWMLVLERLRRQSSPPGRDASRSGGNQNEQSS